MSNRCAPHAGSLSVLVPLFAACVAALIAHVGIDVAGDFLLAHDTYDGVDHGSRSDIFVFGIAIALGALVRFAWGALDELQTGAGARTNFAGALGRKPWRFAAVVVALTVAAVAAMEAIDLRCGGTALDDVADLFGGSLALGLSLTVVVATLCACAVRYVARGLCASQRSIAIVLRQLVALTTRSGRPVSALRERAGVAAVVCYRSIVARRCAKRGPPLFVN